MAFNKATTLDALTIRANGILELRTKISVDEDGEVIGSKYHRQVFEPGDDVSAQPLKLRQIANVVWTPAVIAAWEAEKAARLAALPQ